VSDPSQQRQKQVWSGFNKADSASTQLLLYSATLLKLSRSFISFRRSKSTKSRFLAAMQLFIRPTALATWVSHVTMLFLSFFNKSKAHFLMPKNLSLAHSSSYFRAA
jgi:hypothetical protein